MADQYEGSENKPPINNMRLRGKAVPLNISKLLACRLYGRKQFESLPVLIYHITIDGFHLISFGA